MPHQHFQNFDFFTFCVWKFQFALSDMVFVIFTSRYDVNISVFSNFINTTKDMGFVRINSISVIIQ